MTNQRCIISSNTSPYFNLATEEYLLKNSEDEIFMLYLNDLCVVVGKHQNLLKEINAPWCHKHNITLARRLSGGGTVFQDQGNINFSFIKNCSNPEKLTYQIFTYPIINTLISIGLDVKYSDRNDILLKGHKISGNAMHISKNRVLCHGTLLFNSNLEELSSSLKNTRSNYFDKSIKSVPSKVANISEFLPEPITINAFIEKLYQSIKDSLNSPNESTLNKSEIDAINKLAKEKYSFRDWIYGYSPKYLFRNSFSLNNKTVEFEIGVEKGLVKSFNSENKEVNLLFEKYLVGISHDYTSLQEVFTSNKIIQYFQVYSDEEFCDLFF